MSCSTVHRQLRLSLALLVAAFLALESLAEADQAPTIVVSEAPRQEMIYGMDFERMWYWDELKEKERLVKLAVQDCRVQYVRVGISCGAEIEEGQLDWSTYDTALTSMRMMKAASPNIRFFASPQPLKASVKNAPWTCFPTWITTHDDKGRIVGFNSEKAADYMVRHVRFLREQGLDIAWLDTKNECQKIRPQDIAPMARRIREQMGNQTPLLIAPSSHNYKDGVKWLQEAVRIGETDFFDIAACHNTRQKGTPERFVELVRPFDVPVWNTELHKFWGPDDVAALTSTQIWSVVRAGFSGMNQWCSLGNEKKTHKMFRTMNDGSLEVMRTYYIYKQLVNTSGGGHYLESTIPDGLTTTAAFLKGDALTVWALNATDVPVDSAVIRLAGHTIQGQEIAVTFWGPDNRREGTTGSIPRTAATHFTHPLAARSLYCFAVRL